MAISRRSWEIAKLTRTKSKEVQALAGTGAPLTVIPRAWWPTERGLEQLGSTKVATGAGELELRPGVARLAIRNREAVLSPRSGPRSSPKRRAAGHRR